jgi:hypothetical protein
MQSRGSHLPEHERAIFSEADEEHILRTYEYMALQEEVGMSIHVYT